MDVTACDWEFVILVPTDRYRDTLFAPGLCGATAPRLLGIRQRGKEAWRPMASDAQPVHGSLMASPLVWDRRWVADGWSRALQAVFHAMQARTVAYPDMEKDRAMALAVGLAFLSRQLTGASIQQMGALLVAFGVAERVQGRHVRDALTPGPANPNRED